MDLSTVPFLHKTDHDDEADAPSSSGSTSKIAKFRAFAEILIYVLAFWGIISLLLQTKHVIFRSIDVYRPSTLPKDYDLCACDLKSQDCIYDPLAAAFLPPHCCDPELTAEFEASFMSSSAPSLSRSHHNQHDHNYKNENQGLSWPYYLDANGTRPITVGDIAALGADGIFWATREWHVAHCLWYWEKLVRMRNTGVVMERRFAGIGHVRHCRRLVMKRDANWEKLIEVNVVTSSGLEEDGGG